VTSVSIVCTVWVLKLHHCCPHERPVPTWLRCVVGPCRPPSDRVVPDHHPADRWADRRFPNEPVVRPLWSVSARTSAASPTSGAADEFVRRLRKISTAAERNAVDDDRGQLATTSAHGDRPDSSASASGADPHYGVAAATVHRGASRVAAARPPDATERHGAIARRLAAMEEMVTQLATLLSKKDDEDEDSQVADDWRRVAAFADRCLFWIFLVVTIIYTVTTMVLVPFYVQ